MAIYDVGDIHHTNANGANVPIDIWLVKVDPDDDVPPGIGRPPWVLTANNYMPRKSRLSSPNDVSYRVYAENRADLVAIVRDIWRPLYVNALARLDDMERDHPVETTRCLYYWDPVT